MKDSQLILWVIDRLTKVYGDNPNVDFIHQLRKIVKKLECLETLDEVVE